MPDLSRFAVFARKSRVVPLCSPAREQVGEQENESQRIENKGVMPPVPLVPHVPLENDDAGNEIALRDAFEERAAVLEYDAGLPRDVAERMARMEIEIMRGWQKSTGPGPSTGGVPPFAPRASPDQKVGATPVGGDVR
ncbi:hypothetical protein V5F34_06035 [Xanthobacter autotrophicus]|uniref:hypothetical protein n=1 Tax=Xanthobacter autotrophicus TaxID=280 RepID=UPI003729B4A3